MAFQSNQPRRRPLSRFTKRDVLGTIPPLNDRAGSTDWGKRFRRCVGLSLVLHSLRDAVGFLFVLVIGRADDQLALDYTASLLHHMRELVRQQLAPARTVRRVRALAEEDVLPG